MVAGRSQARAVYGGVMQDLACYALGNSDENRATDTREK